MIGFYRRPGFTGHFGIEYLHCDIMDNHFVLNLMMQVGFKLHKLDMEMKKLMDAGMRAAGYDDVTLTHGWILKYLYDNRDKEIYLIIMWLPI